MNQAKEPWRCTVDHRSAHPHARRTGGGVDTGIRKCPWPESNRLHRNSRAAPAVAPLHAGDRCGRTGESSTYWTVLVRRETDCLMPACVPGAGVEPAFSRTIRRMIRAKSLRARRNGIGFSALAAELPSTRDGRDSNPRPLRYQSEVSDACAPPSRWCRGEKKTEAEMPAIRRFHSN